MSYSGSLRGLLRLSFRECGVGASVTVVLLPARGGPPEAAARRAGLEFVEKVLTAMPSSLDSTDTKAQNTGMLRRVPMHHIVGRAAYRSKLRDALVPVAKRWLGRAPRPCGGHG
jgi:hypothetical protein